MQGFPLAAALVFSTVAAAQPAGVGSAVGVRMQRSADIERVLLGPRGEVFALLLAEGSVIMLPPHLTQDLGLETGQRVQVEGDAVQTPLNFVYHRVRLTRGGQLLLVPGLPGKEAQPAGPPPGPPPEEAAAVGTTARGSLVAFIAGPDGRVNGLVFSDGTVAVGAPHQSVDVSGLTRGTLLEVSGPRLVQAALQLERVTLPDGTFRTLQPLASFGKRE
jgi:hypothetical protein